MPKVDAMLALKRLQQWQSVLDLLDSYKGPPKGSLPSAQGVSAGGTELMGLV